MSTQTALALCVLVTACTPVDPSLGTVRLHANGESAQLFVDARESGRLEGARTLTLARGQHVIELRDQLRVLDSVSVEVIAGGVVDLELDAYAAAPAMRSIDVPNDAASRADRVLSTWYAHAPELRACDERSERTAISVTMHLDRGGNVLEVSINSELDTSIAECIRARASRLVFPELAEDVVFSMAL